jgi:hypothetical protein
MTEEKPPPPAGKKKNTRRGARTRQRGAKRRNKPQQQRGGKHPDPKTHTPKTPHVKVTIRNIQNSAKYGSVKSILQDLVPRLLEKCIECKSNNQYSFDVDTKVVRALIEEEEKVNEYKAAEKARMEGAQKMTEDGEEGHEKGEIVEKDENPPTEKDDSKEDLNLDVIVPPKAVSGLPTITVRPLYVLPARKTRRRGERAGTAYILLIAPKIAELPSSVAKGSADSETKNGEKQEDKTKATTESAGKSSEPDAATSSIDCTRQLARNRLLLDNVLVSLTQIAADDFKSQEHFSGCIVEQSLNGKVLKANTGPPDRREGTIENTADYKKWLESLEEQKEALKSRPKPTPGGGVSLSTQGGDGRDGGQEMSALVQHLRAKKEEIKKRKTIKKQKDGAKAKKEQGAEGKKNRRGGVGGGKKDVDGKKKFKKRKKPRGQNAAAVTPMAVLKPPGT